MSRVQDRQGTKNLSARKLAREQYYRKFRNGNNRHNRHLAPGETRKLLK